MKIRKYLNILMSFVFITSLVFGSVVQVRAQSPNDVVTAPISPTDETKVPHYFGPYPNWANSPFRLPSVTVSIDGGGGTGATAAADVDPQTGALTAISVLTPGSGYTSIPTVTITSDFGTGAAADAVVNYSGTVSAITVDVAGGGYNAPVVSISGGGATTDATATAFGGVDTVSMVDPGSGYSFPTVEFGLPNDPNGVQATGHADMDINGSITAVVIDNPGSGYSAAPAVTIHDGTISDPIIGAFIATAESTIAIQNIVLDTFGAGYTSAPAVTITDLGVGSGAFATAAISTSGSITAIDITTPGQGYVTPGIKKFTDQLPGLCMPPACPTSGKYIPLAVSEAKLYNGIEADEYVIGLVQYRTSFSSSLPDTLVRGYVQLETAANAGISQHFPLMNANVDPNLPDTPVLINGVQAYAVTAPQYLGPTISATKDRPVRIVFYNLLPTGAEGDLFLPTDSSMMGSGEGPTGVMPMNDGTVLDEVRNPRCGESPKPADCYKDNRATLHLHGGVTPWISDGTPHQWITPAGENTTYPEGVSVENVPDMNLCNSASDGCQTFYYTNQQSARLMFYHDHSWGITRLNVYAGEAAGYLITDDTEKALIASGTLPTDQLPLIIQDKTFVPDAAQLASQDPTWDAARWGTKGSFWYHHVYMPAQNPGDPSGMSAYGRWMYGPWFWPPAANTVYGPIANPYYDPNCNLDDPTTWQYQTDPFCEPQEIPGTPNISAGMEQFNDTPIVNGVAYPTTTVEPKAYRLRILSAANDRFFNLQWYVADPTTGTESEVAFKAAELEAAQTDPNVFPTPDTNISLAGPDWIQIGTEGGFLPAPVVIDGQQVTTWITDPTRFDVGNVDQHSLLLAPAERADVIVDFSQFAGKTLILYNDAPAAFPARVPSYDYYTGAPDMSPNGAAAILPGYGPNTRTVMQIKVAANTPAAPFNLTALQNAFKHQANGSGVFESGQPPIIVGQAAYNSAYGTNFAAASNCNVKNSTLQRCDGFVRVNDTAVFGFNTLSAPTTKMTLPLQSKAIHDEMNSTTFDEFGRMQANLGVEAQPPVPGAQNVVLYPFVNPATEFIDATNLPKVDVTYDANGQAVSDITITPISSATDGTQLWRVTHNGVDTHPIHFHLYDVQLVNRVTWDNIILPPDANELGWKDTVRIAPLEDTIVALRAIVPELPFEIPNSVRMLSPMLAAGSTAMFNNVDLNGNPTAPITNQLVNFGWEYVYHCHILSHEEMDMMRPVSLVVPPIKPDGLTFDIATQTLTWNDNSITETSFVAQRSSDGGVTWTTVGAILSPLDAPNIHEARSLVDATYDPNIAYYYRVVAKNLVGYGSGFPTMTAQSVSSTLIVSNDAPVAPTNLTATAVNSSTVNLAWTDNATSENSFRIERATVVDGVTGVFASLGTVGANVTIFSDTSVTPLTSYDYRVFAINPAGESTSNIATVTTPDSVPAAPSGLTAVAPLWNRVNLSWTDSSTNETSFRIERATVTGGVTGAFASVGTVGANVTSFINVTTTPLTTYAYRVVAVNIIGASLPSNVATVTTPDVPPAAPSNLLAASPAWNQVNLSWKDNATNETGFRIERATITGGVTGTFASVGTVGANVLAFSDTSTAPVTNYAYRVFAFNTIGDSPASNVATVLTFDIPPAAPTGLSAIQNGLQVDLVWTDNATNEINYVVERAVNGGAFTALAILGADATSYADTPVTAGTAYTYQVRATNSGGSSAYSNTASVTILAAPTNLTATLLSLTRIRLTWTDITTFETGFVIQRSVNGGAFTTLTTAPAAAGTGNRTYTDATVASGNTYAYQVKAINGANSSAYSNVVNIIDGTAPAAPSNLRGSVLANPLRGSLSWADNANNETGFVLERADNGGAFALLANVAARNGTGGTVNYVDTTITAGNTYVYRVKAVNALGSSVYSNLFTVSVNSPTAPSNFLVTSAPNGTLNTVAVTLTWTDSSNNETGFRIQRATNAAFTTGLNTNTVGANATTRTETRSRPGTYYYRIQSYNAVGASTWVYFTIVIP